MLCVIDMLSYSVFTEEKFHEVLTVHGTVLPVQMFVSQHFKYCSNKDRLIRQMWICAI